MKNKLAITIPHGAALRLLKDVLPIKKIQKKYQIFVICERDLISEKIIKFCDNNEIILKSVDFKNINDFNFLKRFLRNVRAYLYPRKFFNQTLFDFWKVFEYENSKKALTSYKIIFQKILYNLACNFKFIRKFIINLECFLTNTKSEEELLKILGISQILTTSFSGVDANDTMLLASKRLNIYSYCYIQSWDNVSGNGYHLCVPNKVLSYSDSMNIQLKKFQEISSQNIFAVGALQYASWIDFEKEKNKKNNNFKVLYGGKSYKRFPFDYTYVEEIIKAFQVLKIDINLVVRPHPFALRRKNDGSFFYPQISKLVSLVNKYKYITLDIEKVSGEKFIKYENSNSFNSMRDLLLNYDLVINIFSTLALEASLLNIPCINMFYQTKDYKYLNHPSRFNMYQDERQFHNRQLINSIPNADSFDSLKKYIKKALYDKSNYSKNRVRDSLDILGNLKNAEKMFLKSLDI